jgi:peptidoglycan/xylan/chitin deacetylase (PgdA/CDA1 family)
METQTTSTTDAVEFTHAWYRELLDRIRDAGYDCRRFSDGAGDGDVFLRHDVDLSVEDALAMARIEADRGVTATYCLLLTSALYNPLESHQRRRIREIESLGHEVALHFSTHEYWEPSGEPSDDDLRRRIDEERAVLDVLLSKAPETVSFHVPPAWVLNRPLDGVRNTYAPEHFGDVTYVADSGQRWRESPPDVAALESGAQVLTHPGLWGETDRDFEECVARSVDRATDHVEAKAHREFLSGIDDV